MGMIRINLALLRARGQTGGGGPAEPLQAGVTRRDLFRLAGAVTAATALASRPTRTMALNDAIQFIAGDGIAAFQLNGENRWVIDTRRFGGTPRLSVDRADTRIRCELKGATYPGTELPADMVCEAKPGPAGWTLRLNLALAGFRVQIPLEKWLSGDTVAKTLVDLSETAWRLSQSGVLTLNGKARGQFDPDWTFRVEGVGIAHLSGLGPEDLISDSVQIGLKGAGDPSLLTMPPDRRSLITLLRRERVWQVDTSAVASPNWTMTSTDHPFDYLHIESGLNQKGDVRRTLVAEPGTEDSRLVLQARGTGLRLPLTGARYAVGIDKNGIQSVLISRFGGAPAWLTANGCSLLLGDGPGSRGLELSSTNGRLTKATCAPALLGLATPLKNAVVETQMTNPGLHTVALAYDGPPTYEKPPLQEWPADQLPPVEIAPAPQVPVFQVPLTFSLSVIRPEDLLVLRFEFVNLKLMAGGDQPARLVRVNTKNPSYVLVYFQPQAVGEQAFYETDPNYPTSGEPGTESLTNPPVQSRLAGPSRLAFQLPKGVSEIPYSIESLLDWAKYDHSLSPVALPPPTLLTLCVNPDEGECDCEPLIPALVIPPRIQAPTAYQSIIEAPYRVGLSPNKYAAWAHSLTPVTHEDRTELWHTRLGVRAKDGTVDEESTYYRTVRAIWSPDYNASAPPPGSGDTSPFRMSLTSAQRNQIVRLTSDFTIQGYSPKAIQVERLMLSSLGAWLNVRVGMEPPANFTLEEWRHRAVMGRDTYVRVVEKGYLFPYGHRASLVTVTERKFQPSPSGQLTAYLRQRKFIVVRQPDKTFPAQAMAYAGRQMPLKTVRITTVVTPSLDLPQAILPGYGESAFWPRVGNQDFLFHIVTTDGDGQRQEFASPLAFIKSDISDNAALMTQVASKMTSGPVGRRQRPLFAQKVAFAPSDKPGDTSFESESLTFKGEIPDQGATLAADQPRFFPALDEAQVRLSAVERMTSAPSPARIRLHQTYLEKGFDAAANKAAVFLETLDAPALKFPSNMSGGVATPNMGISGISKALGPVGGALSDLIGGNFDPKKFFSDEAKILGGMLLSDILQAVGLTGDSSKDDRVPHLTARVVYPEKDGKEDTNAVPLGVETKLTWKPPVKNDPLNIFVANADTSLSIMAKMFADFDGNPPTFEVNGELKNFKVDLLAPITSFVILTFKELTFVAKNGQKPDVKPKIEKVDFVGPLSFVKALQDFLKMGGGSGSKSPFGLDVTPSGVKASLSLPIPSLTLGVLSIQNMVLSAALNLPFTGDPVRLRFAFCEKANPFILTVSMFGGGGFFSIELGIDGIEKLEAGFEFGGNFALDLGVASGGAYLMAGIYYKMEGEDAQLTGYLKCGGSLEVLGIITVSAEFYMGLTYDIPNDKVWGEATLTVKVEVLFFSVSVDLHVERKFKGSNGDPTFADLTERADWESYCEAFA